MEADEGDKCHITHYSWDSQFCGGLLCLDCMISGMFYNNHNFLLNFNMSDTMDTSPVISHQRSMKSSQADSWIR